jgi:hypothetical protein
MFNARLKRKVIALEERIETLERNAKYFVMTDGSNPYESPRFEQLTADNVLARIDELYSFLSVERKTIRGTPTTAKLVKVK